MENKFKYKTKDKVYVNRSSSNDTGNYREVEGQSYYITSIDLNGYWDYCVWDSFNTSNKDAKYIGWFKEEELTLVEDKESALDKVVVINPTSKESNKAMRFNENKPKWSLVHYESMIPMIQVLEFGSQKYEKNNWMKSMDAEEILESMQRHLAALMDGETHDKESYLHHIGHIMANCMFYSYHNVIKK